MSNQNNAATLRSYLLELKTAELDDVVPAPVIEALEAAVELMEQMPVLKRKLRAEMIAANCGSTPCHMCVDRPCYKEAADDH